MQMIFITLLILSACQGTNINEPVPKPRPTRQTPTAQLHQKQTPVTTPTFESDNTNNNVNSNSSIIDENDPIATHGHPPGDEQKTEQDLQTKPVTTPLSETIKATDPIAAINEGSPDDNPKNETLVSTPTQVDIAASRGSRPCIIDHLQTQQHDYQIPELSEDWQDFESLTTQNQTTDKLLALTDLILRNAVDANGRVDYTLLRQTRRAWFDLLMRSLAVATPPTEELARQAFWINTYNTLMIALIVEEPMIDRVLELGQGVNIFAAALHNVGGQMISLDAIEKGIFRLGDDNAAINDSNHEQVANLDARMHTAFVCGAVSCPNLRPFAYRGPLLDSILNENMLLFANDSKHMRLIDNGLQLTSLFEWYFDDFQRLGDFRDWLPPLTLDTCRPDAQELDQRLDHIDTLMEIDFAYDWRINGQSVEQ